MKFPSRSFLLVGAVLALAVQVRAQIVYSGPQSIAVSSATFPEATPFKIDFNADGIADVELFFRGPTPQLIMIGGLIDGAYSGAVSSTPDFLNAGQAIDSSRTWWTAPLAGSLNFTIGPNSFGSFSGHRGFVATRFTVGTDSFYGWIDYAGSATAPTGTVFGWAYESTPNRSIAAGATGAVAVPEPNTLGLAAAGLLGTIYLVRRRLR